MPAYRIRAQAVREAAARAGDHTLVSIANHTGIHRIALTGLMNGRRTTGLVTVMRFYDAYRIPLEDMVEEVPGGEDDEDIEVAGAAA